MSDMEEPLTEDLLQKLLVSDDPSSFIDENDIGQRNLPGMLADLLDSKNLRRVDVVHEAQLNETFGYQIFKGQRRPSRNKVLQLALAMGLNLKETNRLMQAASVSPLYCKDRRDAIIIFCIDHNATLIETNESLYEFGEDTIC